MRGHTKQDLSDLNYTMISLISNKVNILIVGGGEAAFIKCKSFSREGCNVTVVSKEFCKDFDGVNNNLSNVKLIKGDYNERYVDCNHVVIIATNNKETNEIIKTHCDNKCKLYVHCEDHKKGLFVMPVQGNTANIKFALHTKRSSPKTALFMAKIIENKLFKYTDFIDYTFNIRDKVMKVAGKKDIMNFVCSEDFYFFYALGLQDDILEMFYGEGLKEVLGMKINIGTRRSELAQVQANTVMAMIKEKFDLASEKVLIETKGDKILNVTLDKIGGKGLFVKEIEHAMIEKKADMAVHSMKDVPYDIPEEFEIVAIPVREDVRDAFVAFNNISFYDLPKGARIGTSSLRRGVQLKMIRPDVEIVPIRGNVQTRIAKIEKENLDGIILAAAGLKRLNMENIITNYFDVTEMVPAIAQGALGIEMLKTHPQIDMIKKLDCYDARICVDAERSFMATLNGNCHGCIGAYAYLENDNMHMLGIFDVNGKIVKKQLSGHKNDYIKLGVMLAKMVLEDN